MSRTRTFSSVPIQDKEGQKTRPSPRRLKKPGSALKNSTACRSRHEEAQIPLEKQGRLEPPYVGSYFLRDCQERIPGFGVALVWLWCGFGVALVWLCTPESMPSICLVYGFGLAWGGFRVQDAFAKVRILTPKQNCSPGGMCCLSPAHLEQRLLSREH